jgi:hypothetical protein
MARIPGGIGRMRSSLHCPVAFLACGQLDLLAKNHPLPSKSAFVDRVSNLEECIDLRPARAASR